MLVVDDDRLQLQALCDSLREEGFATTGHDDPERALDALKAQAFDLLLTDLRMPGKDGITMLNQARAIDPDIAVIVLTGYPTVPSAVQALHSGAVDYVPKPVRLGTLLPVLQRSLHMRTLAREKSALEARDRLRTQQLEAANRDLALFGAGVAHDLREPVSIVRSFARLLSDRLPSDVPQEITMFANHIIMAADRADRLVRDLLSFARLGNQPLVLQRVDLNEVVQRARDMVQLSNPACTAEWLVAELPMVWADASLLEQVFVNLLGNALKFSALRKPARIQVSYRLDPGAGHVVSVRDNGEGFNASQADRLFIPFQRLHGANQFEGSGMGLAIVKSIVERHAGTVRAHLPPGGGAEFSVMLPVDNDVTR